MIDFCALWIAKTLKLTLAPEHTHRRFSALVTDSRKIQPGCLFLALPGEKFDGHDFVAQTIDQGALGIIGRSDLLASLREKLKPSGEVCYFPVKDTLQAYRELAQAWRASLKLPIAMVAGSNGKTTTKELLFSLLKGKWKHVLKTQGSQNGFVGIPMTLLELTPEHQAAVIEVGIDEPGAMTSHLSLIEPDVAMLTVIEPEHLEKLIDLQTVAREEGLALTETAARGGAVAINCDDPRIAPFWTEIRSPRKLAYTLKSSPDHSWMQGRVSDDFKELIVCGAGWTQEERFVLPLPGRHNATNLLAALAMSKLLGLTAAEMRQGLRTFNPPDGRSQLKTLSNGTQIICDYYNSQPASLRAGLELLQQLSLAAQAPARWACLADMLELGTLEEHYHREPARWLCDLKIDHVALLGPRMRALEDELKKLKFFGVVRHFSTHSEMAQYVHSQAPAQSVILIKGSHSMNMGEVWNALAELQKSPT